MLFFADCQCLILIVFCLSCTLWRKQSFKLLTCISATYRLHNIAWLSLKKNRQSGGLSQAQYDEQLADLEQALSDDLDIKSHVTRHIVRGRWVVYVLV